MRSYAVFAFDGFPLIKSGDNLAEILVDVAQRNGFKIEDGDVIVIAQKILSKAEGRVFRLGDIDAGGRAEKLAKATKKNPKFVELVLRETRRVLKVSREVLLVLDDRGLVCINAGIDKSNVEGRGNFALLPKDPDESAERLRLDMLRLTDRRVAVVVCDTYSRPFRRGQVNFAIGIAGIDPFRDYRGKKDLFGQVLKVKNVAVVDEVAAAAELLMGQGQEATPVVVLRGLKDIVETCETCSASSLAISSKDDLFSGAL